MPEARWYARRLMADVQPFRAVRYAGAAGPLDDLVAPPYDAVDEVQRAALYTRSQYNVVHVTLPESAGDAERLYAEWLDGGVLVHEDVPAIWAAVESFVGPDGVARERRGAIGSVLAESYEKGSVLPHERTHERTRDERLKLLRATRVQPEPILLLAERSVPVEAPDRSADVEAGATRLWRLESSAAFDPGQLLVADGHHRYEAALALASELGEPVRIMALVVPVDDPGLRIFPTHRLYANRPDLRELGGEPQPSLEQALAYVRGESFERSIAVAYHRGGVEVLRGEAQELDVQLVDRFGLEGIGYTQSLEHARASVDSGAADIALLLRPLRIDDVFAAARSGVRMPPKSTYFHPKPLSGLLFHPVTS